MYIGTAFSQQYVLVLQGQHIKTYNSQNECEEAKEKMGGSDKQKLIDSWNNVVGDGAIFSRISANDVPDFSFNKLCKCISLSEYKQMETGKKYVPLLYGAELIKFFEKVDSKLLEAMAPKLASHMTNYMDLKKYDTPDEPTIAGNYKEIESRNNELLTDLDEEFDMEESVVNILSEFDTLIDNLGNDMSEEDLSILIEEINRLRAELEELNKQNSQKENEKTIDPLQKQ